MQAVQRLTIQRRRANRNEARVFVGVGDQRIHVLLHGHVHELLFGMLDEHFAQLVEIRVLQTLVGNDIVENRNILRNGDALVLRYVLVPHFQTGV